MSSQRFPRMFGKYALLRPFARGGMGEIYLAAHGELGGAEKLCLVKKVPEDRDAPGLTARLLDEAKVAVRLNHTNLVQVFDAGNVDDELYIAMELIEGRDLRAVWNRTAERRSRIPLDVALYVVREIARGLEYAHNYGGLGLVHRDIAPPNILISFHGEVKVTDFGLARSILKNERTAPGIVYGRIAYLAPEQARGEQADARTDIFATGVILWELLTGRPLHDTGDDAVKNLDQARHPAHRGAVAPDARAAAVDRRRVAQGAGDRSRAALPDRRRVPQGASPTSWRASRRAPTRRACRRSSRTSSATRSSARRPSASACCARSCPSCARRARASRSATTTAVRCAQERIRRAPAAGAAADAPGHPGDDARAARRLARHPTCSTTIRRRRACAAAGDRRAGRAPGAAAAAGHARRAKAAARPLPGMRPTPPPSAGHRKPRAADPLDAEPRRPTTTTTSAP